MVFKHKEKQQQLVDAKLQRTAELMRELEGKQQRERDFVSPTAVGCYDDALASYK